MLRFDHLTLVCTLALIAACGKEKPVQPPDSDAGADSGVTTPDQGTTTRDTGGGSDASNTADSGTPDSGQPGVDMGSTDDGPVKAFPRAYGGGAEATGGRGGVLVIVNTDDPNAPLEHFEATAETPERYEGGLYAALQLPEPAYVTFDRSMNIHLGVGGTRGTFGYDGIPNVSDKTIYGQSAPRGGITITDGTFRFDNVESNSGNVIFQYLRSRPILNQDGVTDAEDDSHTWGLLLIGGHDIVVDHCSFSFAHDKAVGGFLFSPEVALERITFSRNLISDSHTGAYVEINPGRPGEPEKSVDDISWHANAVIGINRTPNIAFDGYGEVINNVIFGNNYKSSTIYHELRLNHVANYYERPGGSTSSGFNRIFDHDSSTPRIFTTGNYWDGLLTGAEGEDNRAVWKYRDTYDQMVSADWFVDAPFPNDQAFPYPAMTALEAHASVVTDGDIGANAYLDDDGRPARYHDPYDADQLESMRSGDRVDTHDPANWVLPEIPETVRPESYDTDKDGLADAWETRVIGDLSQSYGDDHDGDGYPNIEEFMFQVDAL